MFLGRDRRGGTRFLRWRVGLFLLGATVWLVGLFTDQPLLTGAAIFIILAALLLGILARSD
jgi:uncharacterized membrane protein YiaA